MSQSCGFLGGVKPILWIVRLFGLNRRLSGFCRRLFWIELEILLEGSCYSFFTPSNPGFVLGSVMALKCTKCPDNSVRSTSYCSLRILLPAPLLPADFKGGGA